MVRKEGEREGGREGGRERPGGRKQKPVCMITN